MNLADMLTYADISQLGRIADHYQCDCNGNSKHELIQSILQRIGRREFLEQHIEEMSIEDLRFLNMLIFDRRRHFSLEELVACAQHARFTEDAREKEKPREVISRFRQRGWLFQGMTQNTRYLYEVPEDLRRRFREVLERRFIAGMVALKGEPSIYREEPELLSEDMLLLLRYIRDHEVPLNNEGVMYRRNQQQLLEGLHITEPLVGKGWRFGYGRRFKDYPNRMSLLYDYATQSRWIQENPVSLTLTSTGESYLLAERREPMMQFVLLWLRLYKGPIPNLLSLIYWTMHCCREWVTLASLYNNLLPLIKPYFYDSSESIFEERLIQMLLHLGMVRIGDNGQGEKYIRTTPFGRTAVHKLTKE